MSITMITKNVTKGDELVVMPRKEYDRFLAVYKKFGSDVKESEADNDILKGRLSRTYKTKKELAVALNKLKR